MDQDELTAEELKSARAFVGAPVYAMSQEDLDKQVKESEEYWTQLQSAREPSIVDVSILEDFLLGVGENPQPELDEPGDYKGGQLPVMPRTVGLPTHAALPEKSKKAFPEKSRRPMIRLYCFPGAADNYMLWLRIATSAPEWCEVAVYEPRAHGFRPDEPWDRTLEERAADAVKVMRPAFETHAKGGASEGAPFAFLSHGIGGQFMALVAQRLKREMNIEPLAVFANDGPPSNVPTLTPEGYKLMCEDAYKFYEVFQPGTIEQIKKLGRDTRAGQALLQKWYRSMRMFEEHAYRTVAKGKPFHKFNCDLWCLEARHTMELGQNLSSMPAAFQKHWEEKKWVTASGPDSGNLWSRESFQKWEEWTTEDFHYVQVETDHDSAKNALEVQNIVFQELACFCGMDYSPVK
eukprot:TRINITY_DN108923_c0_g1_i1.p1 TRINITY_DN108923_c0_g1~~TRINITY_DN108923_c0_g1_i1.p1  ORF type:complete len:420 (-),score=88.31 TRINITY_DN108923_c0_g1_i1:77-1294(-)